MTKDAFWFPHDSNARRDPKMMRLRMKHGQKGKAFYWDAIEFLREQPEYKATQEDFEALEFETGKEGNGMTNALIDAKLLEQEDGFIFSKSLKERMFKWDEKKRKLSEAGKRGGRPKKGSEKGGFKQDKPSQKASESQPKAITEHNITEENSTEHNKKYSDDSLRVAEYLLKCIIEHSPDFRKPNIEKWAEEIDRAIRIDKRTPRDLCEVARWATSDTDFWQGNILSAVKLRKQFDQVQIKMRKEQQTKQPAQTKPKSRFEQLIENDAIERARKIELNGQG
jgi:hypothetical protein